MLTKNANDLFQLYVIYGHANNQDIKFCDIGLRRFDFGLPYIKELILEYDEYIKFLNESTQEFIKDCVFDDKYLAYKKWQELLTTKVQEITEFLNT